MVCSIAVDTDVGLHVEVPLIALLGLMHVEIARLVGVLGRRRGIDDGGVDDRPGRHLQAACFQMAMHFPEYRLPRSCC
jgi:hypothetical protein